MLKHSTFTLRSYRKNINREYLLSLIRISEINEKMHKNQVDVLTKLLLSQLLSALEYQNNYMEGSGDATIN